MTRSRLIGILIFIVLVCSGGIGVMYLIAQQTGPLGGGFSRTMLVNKALEADDTVMLGYDSYYLAGTGRRSFYFGNKVGPRHVLTYDLVERDTQHLLLQVLNRDSVLFQSLQLRVDSPTFFLYDGSTPVVFKGEGGQATVSSEKQASSYFVQAVPRDGDCMFVYGYDTSRRGRIGLLQVSTGDTVFPSSLFPDDGDGVFSLDGMMHYDKTQRRFVYLYHYRNEFLVTDSLLREVRRGHTIDTNRVAHIAVATKSDGALVKQGRPRVVNMHSTVFGAYLYVHSKAISDEEEVSDFKKHEVIDVYEYEGRGYVGSFYLQARDRDEIRALAVAGNKLMALHKSDAVIYSLQKIIGEQSP